MKTEKEFLNDCELIIVDLMKSYRNKKNLNNGSNDSKYVFGEGKNVPYHYLLNFHSSPETMTAVYVCEIEAADIIVEFNYDAVDEDIESSIYESFSHEYWSKAIIEKKEKEKIEADAKKNQPKPVEKPEQKKQNADVNIKKSYDIFNTKSAKENEDAAKKANSTINKENIIKKANDIINRYENETKNSNDNISKAVKGYKALFEVLSLIGGLEDM